MGMQLVNTMREVLTARDWWHLPRFVYGSSRGGAMALIMAQRFPFQARFLHKYACNVHRSLPRKQVGNLLQTAPIRRPPSISELDTLLNA